MTSFLAFTIFGLYSGAAYAIAASGLVLTYSTTRVFNIAHGALAMMLSFVYWDFSQRQGLPVWLSLFLVLFVVAPAIGWMISRFVAKGLGDSPVSVSLVVTVGLLVIIFGIAQTVWPPTARSVPPFFVGRSISFGEVQMTYHQALTVVLSGVVAFALYALLYRTRIGVAMRASVDNPELLRLFGGKPDQVANLSWMVGTSLAALAGILLASLVGLDYFALILLVINCFAAAVVGRLKSLPLTFAGAMALGLAESYGLGYLPSEGIANLVRNCIAPLFLFVVLIGLPQTQLRIGQVKGLVYVPVPRMPQQLGWGGALVVGVLLISTTASETRLLQVGIAAAFAIAMLSLVLLTGYGGYVSLAQISFVGVGALAYCKLDQPTLGGLLLSALIAAGAGALVALPVLRLAGLYLALATLAFAVIMDKIVFQADFAFGYNGQLPARRLSVPGYTFASTGEYVVMMTFFFVVVALGVLWLRRGVVGRMLIALRDSPAACGTLGLDQRVFRVALFALSAGVAGLGGALYAGLRQGVGAAEFNFFQSLLLLLLAGIWGVTSVTGAALGGAGLVVFQNATGNATIGGLAFVVLGAGAVLLSRDPNGLANQLFKLGRLLERRLGPALRERIPVLPAGAGLPGRRAKGEVPEPVEVAGHESTEEVNVGVAARGA